ncbi:wall-associated receptor kinase-like 14 [Rhodamnia argentea]|uniref:Wall-associated receptor kinase-like 14 n=1 Tax=Rhodamnia argentea TaxID=178133 RepID=A0A8B8P3Y2_9MYRT|nr:wall-associated receptor kinase-like 14 [Rhodamnia argentea]XP_030529463.1 wall-associated receptor kinase-like 14 [Rhodamnia argentea]
MVFQQAILAIITTLSIISLAEAHNAMNCNRSCGTGASAKHVNFPFGFSGDCEIQLGCAHNSEIRIGEFRVLNLTPYSIIVDLPAKCNRPVTSIKSLFSKNYAPTWTNGFLFQKCKVPLSGCLVPASFVKNRFVNESCQGENITCYSKESNQGVDLIAYGSLINKGCDFLFSSIAAVDPEKNSLEFQALELGWWLNGSCDYCSVNASCTSVPLLGGGSGFRCECDHGFEGDGFIHGEGCRKASSCGTSNYFSRGCKGSIRVIGGVTAGASLMAALAVICFFAHRRSATLRNQMSVKRLLCEAAGNSSLPLYQYKDIERATNNFSERQRLGTGAYGTVYAGKLHNDEWVAIKKIRHRDTDSIDQVMNEIKLLSSVSHPNLVQLLGCCIEQGEQILVYEFMPNGTLSQHLQRERGKGLPWTIRLTIAAETARAIAYLHSAVNPPIYHRDIKSSNILLDYHYRSKVADFGLSRLGMTETGDSHISTAPQGTPGYLDPQYHQNFHLSDKSDVYSFGVVLVEIITALKVVDFSRPHSEVNLAALAVDRIGRGSVDDIIDPFLDPQRDAWTLSSIHKVAELAFRCLAFHKDMRPSMTEVAGELEQIRLSGWAPLEEHIFAASSVASSCSSPYNGSERSFGGMSMKRAPASQRLVVTPRAADSLGSVEELKDSSPVSIQDSWLSEQSSPSTTSLLSNVVR